MDSTSPASLLGGRSVAQFMQRHWQRRPLLVRGAWPGIEPPLSRTALFALAARDDVESRLVSRTGSAWSVRHGPLPRRTLPPLRQREWTLLVQGVDLHADAAHALLRAFRFVPDARLDDVMVSYASDGGGVGAHVDAYDVFLLQLQGRRRWRVGRAADRRCIDGAPLKLLRRFEPTHEWLLEPGDMLYLPPQWGHEGTAEGECMTASIGFRAPAADELARALLHGVAESIDEPDGTSPRYVDPPGSGCATPAAVPPALQAFAREAWQRAAQQPGALERALGQWLTEPKAQVWFEPGRAAAGGSAQQRAGARPLVLDRRTRMLYDERHVFINGESFIAAGRDAQCLRQLADARSLPAAGVRQLSRGARQIVQQWLTAGWAHEC